MHQAPFSLEIYYTNMPPLSPKSSLTDFSLDPPSTSSSSSTTGTRPLPPHLQIYTWPNCTLRELSHLLTSALPSLLPDPVVGTRLAFRLVYPDTTGSGPAPTGGGGGGGSAGGAWGMNGKYQSKDLGSVIVAALPEEGDGDGGRARERRKEVTEGTNGHGVSKAGAEEHDGGAEEKVNGNGKMMSTDSEEGHENGNNKDDKMDVDDDNNNNNNNNNIKTDGNTNDDETHADNSTQNGETTNPKPTLKDEQEANLDPTGLATAILTGDPDRTLQDARFVIGDFVDVAILPAGRDASVANAPPVVRGRGAVAGGDGGYRRGGAGPNGYGYGRGGGGKGFKYESRVKGPSCRDKECKNPTS